MGISDFRLASLREKISKAAGNGHSLKHATSVVEGHTELIDEASFKSFLALERRRAERSKKTFVLMLLDMDTMMRSGSTRVHPEQLIGALQSATRETDLFGWYEKGEIFGIIFTEINSVGETIPADVLRAKVEKALNERLGSTRARRIGISMHIFPQPENDSKKGPVADSQLYPDLELRENKRRGALLLKRAIDLAGSGFLLVLFSPLFALIAAAIKFSSKGPVLFKQERLGQFGERFVCLKFRTMFANNDPKIHQEYAKQFISKNDSASVGEGDKAVYKIVNDPRVTSVGRWLRKTSLDELPQFLNVFSGDMSLVGPRPPVQYEFEMYDHWHRRRVLELKPGVTGLWQVSGRSRTKFDDMVRLDLQYYRTWSVWLDVKILFRTPFAVIFGDGAY